MNLSVKVESIISLIEKENLESKFTSEEVSWLKGILGDVEFPKMNTKDAIKKIKDFLSSPKAKNRDKIISKQVIGVLRKI